MKGLIFVLQILPALIDALKAIETIWPDAGKGADKLELLRGLLEKVYPSAAEMWPAVEKAVSVLVGTFNKTGIFK